MIGNELIEYMRIHLISLEQDLSELSDKMSYLDPDSKDFTELDFEYNHLSGQALATAHLLSVAQDIMEKRGSNA